MSSAQGASQAWRERRQAALLPRAAMQCVKGGDVEKLHDMMQEHGPQRLLMLSSSQSSLYTAALEEGHMATADFIREKATEMLVADMRQMLEMPDNPHPKIASTFIQRQLRAHLDAGADLSRPTNFSQGLLPVHILCQQTISGGRKLTESDSKFAMAAQIVEFIAKTAPMTVLCPTPCGKLALELAVENPSLKDSIAPVLCEHLGALLLKQPRLGDLGTVRRAARFAAEHCDGERPKHLAKLVGAVAGTGQINEDQQLNPLVAYESWSERHQRLALMQPLLSAIGAAAEHCSAAEAGAELAELKATLENERREHQEQVAELTRALDTAQRAVEAVEKQTKVTTAEKHEDFAIREERFAIREEQCKPAAGAIEPTEHAVFENGEDTSSRSAAEGIVHHIRQQRGLDMDLSLVPAVVAESTRAMQRSIGAAVERLSQDLYTSRCHFVLELIQNADDNSYADDVSPKLELCLSRRDDEKTYYFAAVNNELGLIRSDVEALCDINRSTKHSSRGQIGRKGVGWKSVFAVSDCPTVLSNSFRFCFNVRGLGRLGYVTPETLSDESYLEHIPGLLRQAHQGLATVLLLPLRTAESSSSTADIPSDAMAGSLLASMVRDGVETLFANPAWLLFLRRLRYVAWEDRTARPPRQMIVERSADVLTMKVSNMHTGALESKEVRYFVHRQVVTVPADLWQEGSREEEIVVAFHPDMAAASQAVQASSIDGNRANAESRQSRQPVFCFLPVRSVGFRFLLHAPWVLTSNREDWHLESPWNRWLRDASARVLAEAIARFSKELGDEVLQLLDARCVLDPFWRRLLADAASALGDAPIVPIEGFGPGGSSLARPSEVLTPSAAFMRSQNAVQFLRMIPTATWFELTGKYLARLPESTFNSASLANAGASEVARSLLDLGAEQLSLQRLKQVLNSKVAAPYLAQPKHFKAFLDVLGIFLDPLQLMGSSACDFRATAEASNHGTRKLLVDVVADLQQIRAFPLECADCSGSEVQLACLADGDIFLPGTAGPWCPGLKHETCARLSRHRGVRILARNAWNGLQASGRALLQHHLGFREPTVVDIAAAVVRVHALQLSEAACISLPSAAFMNETQRREEQVEPDIVVATIWAGFEAVRVAREEDLVRETTGMQSHAGQIVPANCGMPCLRGGSSDLSLDTTALSRVLWLPCRRSACNDGELLLRRVHALVLPSVLGIPVLPSGVSSASGLCPSVSLEDDDNLSDVGKQQSICITPSGLGFEGRLQAESFLGDFGCASPPREWIQSVEVEVAKMIVSRMFWQALLKSAFLRRHASRLFRKCSRWLSGLLVPGPEGSQATPVHDHFCRHIFEPMVGAGALPFVDVPEECVALLEPLRIPAQRSLAHLTKALEMWTKQSPVPVCVPESLCTALFAAAHSTTSEAGVSSVLLQLRKLIFVPGRGNLEFHCVVWSAQGELASSVCEYLDIPVLCKFYSGKLRDWFCDCLGVQAKPAVPHLIRTLGQISGDVVGTGQNYEGSESKLHADFLQSQSAKPKVTLAFVRAIYEKLFHEASENTLPLDSVLACAEEKSETEADSARHRDKRQRLAPRWKLDVVKSISNAFAHMRLVILPQTGDRTWKFVKSHEAFWRVEESVAGLPCSLWALEVFYSGVRSLGEDQRLNLQVFFIEVVGVPELLTQEGLLRRCQLQNLQTTPDSQHRGVAGRDGAHRPTPDGVVAEVAVHDDDSSLRSTDLLGDDPSVLHRFFPTLCFQYPASSSGNTMGKLSRSSRASMSGSHNEDVNAQEATLSAHAAHCIQRLRAAQLGDAFFSSSATMHGEKSSRSGNFSLRRVEGWEHQGMRLYASGASMGVCGPSELKHFGLVRAEGSHGGVAASPSLATRAAAFVDMVLLPLVQVLEVPACCIAIAVGPGIGRGRNVNGAIVLGLACFKNSEGREERCRWFSEVCRLLAEGGSGGFSGVDLTTALVAWHLPRLIELESSGEATALASCM